ncbi:MAG TPA: carboxypeptidase regulatory-like domain-containing protein, partial [Longimicrobium sp.]|nr:carboxypeptidase regulatory-like domain-containing protein [Longimicrobium sp.]
MNRSRSLLAAILAAALAAAPAAAQTVRGSLVDPAGAPVGRVLVFLLDDAGRQLAGAMTDAGGAFTLRAPAAGRFRLRAERVGYATTTTPPFDLGAGETRAERVVAGGPVALEGIIAQAEERRCAVRPESGLRTAMLWEEARKAINAAAFGQRERLFRYQVVQYDRDLDPRSGRVQREERRPTAALAAHPFASPPAKELSEKGYVQKTPEGVMYYGPDPNVLLSDEFLTDHCLRIAEDDRAAGDSLVGLAFEPVRGRRVPEIRGTLWLDRRTAELRRVDYAYTGMPEPVTHPRLGGTVEYERLSEGPWIVRRWAIRMPRVEMLHGQRTLPNTGSILHDYDDARLAGILEVGGEVQSTATRAGVPVLAAARPGVLEGTVWDSTAAAPLAGARVSLAGTGAAAETDAAGRFRMEGVPAGSYTVTFAHPALGPLAAAARPATVDLAAGRTSTVELAVPGWESAARALCADSTRALYPGVILGRVAGAAAGAAPTVTAVWTRTVAGAGAAPRAEVRTRSVRAEADGSYVLCGVPEGRPFQLSAGTGEASSGDREVRVEPGAPLRHDLALGTAAERVRLAEGGTADAAIPVPGVTAVGRPTLIDFERRRRGGRGLHITRAEIEEKRAVQTVDLFRGLPGVRIVDGPGGGKVQMAGSSVPRFNDQILPPSDRERHGARAPVEVAEALVPHVERDERRAEGEEGRADEGAQRGLAQGDRGLGQHPEEGAEEHERERDRGRLVERPEQGGVRAGAVRGEEGEAGLDHQQRRDERRGEQRQQERPAVAQAVAQGARAGALDALEVDAPEQVERAVERPEEAGA